MNRLEPFTPIGLQDSPEDRKLFSKESMKHPGRMRLSLARECLERYPSQKVVDPMMGIGTTGLACYQTDVFEFMGYEIDAEWFNHGMMNISTLTGPTFKYEVYCEDSAQPRYTRVRDLIVTSPPFPNAHSQGKSEMQQGIRSAKDTHAGNDFSTNKLWGCGHSPKPKVWGAQLTHVLNPWVRSLEQGGHCLVHIKNFVRDNREIDASCWVAESMWDLGLKVLGYHPVPLKQRSFFEEQRRYPKVLVLDRDYNRREEIWEEYLKCGHVKKRKTYNSEKKPKKAVCVECGPVSGLVEIREERIVVGLKI